jgi:hypothetical protein
MGDQPTKWKAEEEAPPGSPSRPISPAPLVSVEEVRKRFGSPREDGATPGALPPRWGGTSIKALIGEQLRRNKDISEEVEATTHGEPNIFFVSMPPAEDVELAPGGQLRLKPEALAAAKRRVMERQEAAGAPLDSRIREAQGPEEEPWRCPHCGAVGAPGSNDLLPDGVGACFSCGKLVEHLAPRCPSCKRRFAAVHFSCYPNGRMCPNCGSER